MANETETEVVKEEVVPMPEIAPATVSEDGWSWHWFDGVLMVACLGFGLLLGCLFFRSPEYRFIKAAPDMSFSFERLTELDRSIDRVECRLDRAKSYRSSWQADAQRLVGENDTGAADENWTITFLPNGIQLTK
jgi:hypothetical protein